MDVGLLVLLSSFVAIGGAALVVAGRALAPFRAPMSAGGGIVRATGTRGAVVVGVGLALGVAVLAGATLIVDAPVLRSLLEGAPLLVVAGALLLFAAVPAARRPGSVRATAQLAPRRPWDTAPRSWFAVVGGAAVLLVLLAVLSALRRPEVPDASGFVRWRASFGEAALSAFAVPGEAVGVLVGLVVLLVATWAALAAVARIPALPEGYGAAERTARGVSGRVVLTSSGGAVVLMLGAALVRIGFAGWSWGTASDLDGAWTDPALAGVGAVLLVVGAIGVIAAIGAWVAAIVLVARMLRPGGRAA